MLSMNPLCSGAPVPDSQVLMYAHYFRKPVTRTGEKTHLSFHYLQLLSLVTHSVPDQNGRHSTFFKE